MCFSKLCHWMFDLFSIFSALFLRTESQGKVFLMSCSQNGVNTQWKIAAEKVNIMDVIQNQHSIFFPKSNSVHYYELTMEL